MTPHPNIKKHGLNFLLLFVILIIAHWSLVTFCHSTKWDFIDLSIPWRYFLGESLRAGIFPLWLPYQNLGYPAYYDLQNFYPIAWLFSYFRPYDLYSANIELLFHYFFAGIGMYYLALKNKIQSPFAFAAGVAYMLCGFMISNAQHLGWIVSACWLPFLFGAYKSFIDNPKISSVFLIVVLVFLFVSGGYAAFNIIACYILFSFFIFKIAQLFKQKEFSKIRKLFLFNSYLLIVCAICCSVLLYSVYSLSLEISRGKSVSLEQSDFGAFTWQSCISFIFPYATVKNSDFFQTDIALANGYFGLMGLLFFIVGIISFVRFPKTISAEHKLLIFIATISLLAALGTNFIIREALFRFAPLMNYFRFPSIFRIFFILFAILVSSYFMQEYFSNKQPRKNLFFSFLIVFVTALGVSAYVYFRHRDIYVREFISKAFFVFTKDYDKNAHIVAQSLFVFPLIFLLYYFLIVKKNLRVTIFLIVLDCTIAAMLNAPYTTFSEDVNLKESNKLFEKIPKEFPVPDMSPLKTDADAGHESFPFWRNTSIFRKQLSPDGMSPFITTAFEYQVDSIPDKFSLITKNPALFFTNKVIDIKEIRSKPLNEIDSSTIFIAKNDFINMDNEAIGMPIKSKITPIKFSPDEMTIDANVSSSGILVFIHSIHANWNVLVDGNKEKIIPVNRSFMGVSLSKGSHLISFEFKNQILKIFFYISVYSFLLCFLLWVFLSLKANGAKKHL